MGAVERVQLVMHELQRVHNELEAEKITPTLASPVFTAPYSSHVSLILAMCLLHCSDFLSLAELTGLLLRLSPPCADLLVTCVRNVPDRWESALSSVLDEAEGEWVEWASAVSSAASIPPLLVAVSTTLHMLSQLSPRLATKIRSSWESLMARLIPADSSAASLLVARTTAAHLPPSVSFLAETALSLTVYFVKDTIGFLSSQYYPTSTASNPTQSQSSSTISHLMLPYLAVHGGIPAPANKEAKARPEEQQQQSKDTLLAGAAGASSGKAAGFRDSPARPALIRSTSATQPPPTTQPASSPTSAHGKANQSPVVPISAPVPQCIGLCRRHMSKSLHQLLVQRKSLCTGPSTATSALVLSENSAQCVTMVRLWCALSGVSGWQLETGDATNLLLLISPTSSDESSYMNDGGELSMVVLCFLLLCRQVSLATQLTGLWSMAHTSIRQTAIAGISSSVDASSAAVTADTLLSVYLAFCRRRSTEILLPPLLHTALALSSGCPFTPSSDWQTVIPLLQQEFGRNNLITSLLPHALGRGSVVLHMQAVHWLLVNGTVERSLVLRCGGWLYQLLSGERKAGAAVLLSPLCLSLVELLALADVESESAVHAVDSRLLTEREVRLLLHLPLSSSLMPPVSSSPASSFSSPSTNSCLAHHWLTSFTASSFHSSLPSILVGLYYVSYYDLLCHNSQREDMLGFNPRQPPTSYPSTLLLSLPLPLISRLVMRHGAELGVQDSLRQLWAAVVARGKERGEEGWAVVLPSPSSLPTPFSPAQMTELSVDAFAALCADVATQSHEVAAVLRWLYELAHRQLIETTEWIASLSSSSCCLHYVDSLVDVLLPALLHSPTMNSDVLSYFVPLCQLFLDVLGVTFAYALMRRLLPAERSSLSLLDFLVDPTVLLSCSQVWWTSPLLLPLLTSCLSSLLLASRTYYRSLQSHHLIHTVMPPAQSTTDTPKPSPPAKSHGHITYFPHTTPSLLSTSTPAPSTSLPLIESARDGLIRDSERRHHKRFPYLRLDEQREASGGEYHRTWQRLMDRGRQALSVGGGEVDGLGRDESVWGVCERVGRVAHGAACGKCGGSYKARSRSDDGSRRAG